MQVRVSIRQTGYHLDVNSGTKNTSGADFAPPRAHRVVDAAAAYERVKQHIKEALANGEWPPGARMPSEAHWVKHFAVSRMTAHRALRELQSEGLIDRVQGVGTFSAQLNRVSSTLTIRDIHEEILARGHRHTARVHLLREENATAAIAARMQLVVGGIVFHSIIVHFENDIALQLEDRYVNPISAPDYLTVDFTQITPTHYLLSVAPLREAEFAVAAGLPSAREARLLEIAAEDPCLIVTRRTLNQARVITSARLVHPAGHYQIVGAFRP
jgi:GntR family transcriptional regulator, histidine utilization repressor